MMGFNLLDEWWKMKSYTKWYHYFWGMPLIALTIIIAWIVISVTGLVLSFVTALRNMIKEFIKRVFK